MEDSEKSWATKKAGQLIVCVPSLRNKGTRNAGSQKSNINQFLHRQIRKKKTTCSSVSMVP